ncbi:hypothetical protein EG850_11190 [Gulosibacter macacae]|uniref:Uncharacterized protein n=1 Tax=Gulosibacter macacae TaxID=2488791 RepID=A0A3P3VZ35_9MICO|nr:hypothetical protein [Gulosibacter macacae]RRJ85943.1 hypothetical protein EG850_11190 [Gulosibacter macacae]
MARTEYTDFETFVLARTDLTSVEAIGQAAGVSRSTYYRHRLPRLPIHLVVAALETLDLPMLEGLIAAGWIDQAEVNHLATPAQLELLPDSKLLGHLLHRATLREEAALENVTDLDQMRTARTARNEPVTAPKDLLDDFDHEEQSAATKRGVHSVEDIYHEEP